MKSFLNLNEEASQSNGSPFLCPTCHTRFPYFAEENLKVAVNLLQAGPEETFCRSRSFFRNFFLQQTNKQLPQILPGRCFHIKGDENE